MLNVPQLRASIPEQFIFSFSHSFKALLRGGGQSGSATGVLAEAATILRDHDCADVRTYLYAPLWDQLEYKLQEALKHCLPLCLYIDGLPLAPLQWLECQEGLYRAIMELLTEYVFGSRLFIFASLTEQALAKASPEGNGLRDFEELFVRRLG